MTNTAQNYDDIFEKGNSSDLGDFFKFQKVGDKIAGTYIDLMESVDGYDNEQYVVVLENNGTRHRVSVRKTHVVLVDRLKAVKFGQIIGFLFEEERENKNGAQKSKIINIKQNPSIVDEAWMTAKVEEATRFGISAEDALTPKFSDSPTATVAPQAPVAQQAPVAIDEGVPFSSPISPELGSTILTLMSNKGLVAADAAQPEVSAKVLELTGLELTAENGPAIINKIATS